MAVICLNCDGWGCAQCANEREAARGGEQGPTALELQVEHLRGEVKRCRDGQARITAQRDEARAEATQLRRERDLLAGSALLALSAAGICTPMEGYVHAPHALAWDIAKLTRERDAREPVRVGWDANGREV